MRQCFLSPYESRVYKHQNSEKTCIQDTLSSRAALGLPAAFRPLGRVRRASKGILHTMKRHDRNQRNAVQLLIVYSLITVSLSVIILI